MKNFEEDFYKVPEEPAFKIVSEEESIRLKKAEEEKQKEEQQRQQLEEERRYEEELMKRQQEYEQEYEQQYQEEYQRRKQQLDQIEQLRRSELDPDRIGDQFLEKLRARNRLIDAEEQQRMNEKHIMQHPNRYSIARMLRELDQPIVIVIRGLIGSGKSKAAKCIKEEIQELNEDLNVRVISIDDYFMEAVEINVLENGKRVTRKTIKYMYDHDKLDEYKDMMYQKLEKTLSNRQHEVIIMDACNNMKSDLDTIARIVHRFHRQSNHQSSLIICEMEEWNEGNCFKYGEHGRSVQDIHRMKRDWFDTPSDMNALDWNFKTSSAQQLKITRQDLESKPMHPELKRVLDHVDSNQKRMRGSGFGNSYPGRGGDYGQQDRRF